jgi:hypothetical protein
MDNLLKEIRTHGSLATIALQTSYALVRGFLARIKVLAVRFAVTVVSVAGLLNAHWGKRWHGVRVESGGSWARPCVGFVFAF